MKIFPTLLRLSLRSESSAEHLLKTKSSPFGISSESVAQLSRGHAQSCRSRHQAQKGQLTLGVKSNRSRHSTDGRQQELDEEWLSSAFNDSSTCQLRSFEFGTPWLETTLKSKFSVQFDPPPFTRFCARAGIPNVHRDAFVI